MARPPLGRPRARLPSLPPGDGVGPQDYLIRIALPRRGGRAASGVRVRALVRELPRSEARGLRGEMQKLAHRATDALAAWAVGHCM